MNVLFSMMPQFFSRLRAPVLFTLVAILFVIDLFVPDFIPFVDEILLAGATVLLSRWRKPEAEVRKPRDAD